MNQAVSGPWLHTFSVRGTEHAVIILMVNDEEKFIQDLAFYKGDMLVVGGPV